MARRWRGVGMPRSRPTGFLLLLHVFIVPAPQRVAHAIEALQLPVERSPTVDPIVAELPEGDLRHPRLLFGIEGEHGQRHPTVLGQFRSPRTEGDASVLSKVKEPKAVEVSGLHPSAPSWSW